MAAAEFDQLSVWERAARGARIGVVKPGMLTVLFALIYLIGGRYRIVRRLHDDFLVLAIAFLPGCAIAGAVIGAALPWTKTFARATIVASFALLPLFTWYGPAFDDGLHHWDGAHTELTAGMSIIFGLMIAKGIRRGQASRRATLSVR